MTAPHLKPFRDLAPESWTFHRHSSRWMFNLINPGADDIPEPGSEYPEAPFVALPEAEPIGATLEQAIHSRESCRDFSQEEMSQAQLSALLYHSVGTCGERLLGNLEVMKRPCPSPGGLYPLEVFAIARRVTDIAPGAHHYHSQTHGLALRREGIAPKPFETYLFMGQDYAVESAVTLVIAFAPSRSLKKYADRGYRYALIEAGHIGQNIALAAEGLGLGACPIGGFLDVELGQLLRLDPDMEFPLYSIAVGPKIAAEKS